MFEFFSFLVSEKKGRRWLQGLFLALLFPSLLSFGSPGFAGERLLICATTPDLKSIAETIGGEAVEAFSFVRGPEDPHFLEVKPSFLKLLNRCQLYLQVGLDLEVGWAPALLQNARNPLVLPGGERFLSLDTVIPPLEVPSLPVDRSMGDVHPRGNPHYLLDPVMGIKVARAIKGKLSALLPDQEERFARNLSSFTQALLEGLLGRALLERYPPQELLGHLEKDELESWLKQEKAEALLGGWLKELQAYRHTPVIADHNLWPYFARRFSLRVLGFLEPKPGIDPSTAHLQRIVELVEREKVPLLLASPYFDPRFIRAVAEKTGIAVVPMAHQTGSREGCSDYLATVKYNLKVLLSSLSGKREGREP